jgi:hypothetical protein
MSWFWATGSPQRGGAATLGDYDPSEDQIVIVFDDSGAHEPEVSIRASETDPDISEIVLDGVVLTTLPTAGAPPLDALVLVGESLADALPLG